MGSTQAELLYYLQSGGLDGAIDRLLDFEKEPEVVTPNLEEFRDPKQPNYATRDVQLWWLARMVTTRRPALEKLTLFWHNHFATSDSKVNAPYLMYQQNEALRAGAAGKFDALLLAMSRDPAMILWLDNRFNIKGRANENFGREIMELFTLGVGHYNEIDVKETARAFTGWTLRRANPKDDGGKGAGSFVFNKAQHDEGVKGVVGSFGPWNGDDVVRILCDHPQTAKYLVEKFWTWFAYPNPEKELVERLATTYKASGLDTTVLLKAMLRSPEFFSTKAERAVYKHPVDLIVAPLRQLGVGDDLALAMTRNGGKIDRDKMLGPLQAARDSLRAFGMDLLYPPDVSGWDGGVSWISSATMMERIRWADGLFGQSKARRPQARLAAAALLTERTPAGIARRFATLLDAPMTPNKLATLEQAAAKGVGQKLTATTANVAAANVCRLIFASPEFQFS